jgi:hypothetical protein
MLDTLTIVKKITAAGMPVQQAEAMAETFVSSLEDEVASKRDLEDVRKDLKAEISDLRKEVKRDVQDLESKLIYKMEENVSRFEKAMERMQFQMLRAGFGMMLGTVALMTFVTRYLGK